MKNKVHHLNRLLAAVALAFVGVSAHAVDAFDSVDGLLTLDRVSVNGTTYRSIVASVNAYTLIGLAGGAPLESTFDTATNTLVIGAVALQGVTYNNVTVILKAFSLRNSGNIVIAAGATPTTLPANKYSGETAGYFNALNNYRTQCGIEALAENTTLDGIAPSVGTGASPPALATSAGYPSPSTVSAVSNEYLSTSSNATLVGQYELQIALMDPAAMLTLMRPYTQFGMVTTSGTVNQRGARVILGTPVSRNMPTVVTFPCANTTDIAPYDPTNTGSVGYVGPVLGEINDDHLVTGAQGTPIAVYASLGYSLDLTSATVTARGGSSVPVKLKSGAMVSRNEGYVWPQAKLSPNTTYDVTIAAVLGGSYKFTKSFFFKTGAVIPVQNLP